MEPVPLILAPIMRISPNGTLCPGAREYNSLYATVQCPGSRQLRTLIAQNTPQTTVSSASCLPSPSIVASTGPAQHRCDGSGAHQPCTARDSPTHKRASSSAVEPPSVAAWEMVNSPAPAISSLANPLLMFSMPDMIASSRSLLLMFGW